MSGHSNADIEDILSHTVTDFENNHDLDVDLETLLNDDNDEDESPLAPTAAVGAQIRAAASSSSNNNSIPNRSYNTEQTGVVTADGSSLDTAAKCNSSDYLAKRKSIASGAYNPMLLVGAAEEGLPAPNPTPVGDKEHALSTGGGSDHDFEGSIDADEGSDDGRHGGDSSNDLLSTDNAHAAALERLTAAEAKVMKFIEGGNREAMRQSSGSGVSATGAADSSNVSWSCLDVLTVQLQKNVTYRQHGPGPSTRIKVTTTLIAVGTAKGLLLLFDHNQELKQVIGSNVAPANRASSAVTSIDVDKSETMLILGHASGEIALWDLTKGSLAKRVVDLHSHAVTHLTFLRYATEGLAPLFVQPDAGDQSSLDCVSLDSRGIMHKVRFSKHMLWATYSSESECLLDGNVGAILDMTCLPPLTASKGAAAGREAASAGQMPGLQLVAIHTVKKTYVVQIRPAVKVLHRWAVVETDSSSSASLPLDRGLNYLAWSWNINEFTVERDGGSASGPMLQFNPLLARYSGNLVQILSVTLVRNRAEGTGPAFLPAFNVSIERSLSSAISDSILALSWTMHQLVLLTTKKIVFMSNRLEVVDKCAVDEGTSERLNAVAYGSAAGGEGGAMATPAIVPSLASLSKKVYLLSDEAVYMSHVRSSENWLDQPLLLISRGKILDALAASVKALGSRDGSAAAAAKSEVAFLSSKVELLLPQMLSQAGASHKQLLNHYKLVAELCVEYCALTDSMPLLFGPIFDAYAKMGQDAVYLQALEPYILTQQITSVPQQIVSSLLATVAAAPQRAAAIERIFCFMNTHQYVDCEQTGNLLLKYKLHSAFLYTYSFGTLNFRDAFQILFDSMLKQGPALVGVDVATPTPTQTEICYKILVYLRYTAGGLIFPRGERISTISLQAIADLAEALLDTAYSYSYSDRASQGGYSDSPSAPPSAALRARFPYLMALSRVDSVGTVLVAGELLASLTAGGARVPYVLSSHQSLTHMYIALYDFCAYADSADIAGMGHLGGAQPSSIGLVGKGDNNMTRTSFFERKYFYKTFSHLVNLQLELPSKMLCAIVRFCSWHCKSRYAIENSLLTLFSNQMRSSRSIEAAGGSAALVVATLKEHGFWRAAALYSGFPHRGTELFTPREMHEVAVDRYLSLHSAEGESSARQLFAYVNLVCEGVSSLSGCSESAGKFSNYLLQFARISLADTRRLVGRHMCAHAGLVITSTDSDSRLQYSLLEEIVHHDLSAGADQSAEHVARGNVTDAASCVAQQASLNARELLVYVGLVIRYEPQKALPFLTGVFPGSSGSYATNPYSGCGHSIFDDCLELCERYVCADAHAYLLEWRGDIAAALRVLCSEFNRRTLACRVALERGVSFANRGVASSSSSSSLPDNDELYKDLYHVLQCFIALCSRNDGSALLDPLGGGAAPLLDDEASFTPSPSEAIMSAAAVDDTESTAKRTSTKSTLLWHRTFHFLLNERLVLPATSAIGSLGVYSRVDEVLLQYFHRLLRVFMNEMKFHVPAKAMIVSLMQSNNHVVRYDEFKDVTSSMIESYSREITLYDTVNKLMQQDLSQCYKLKYLRRRNAKRCQPRNTYSSEEDLSGEGNLAAILRRTGRIDAVSNGHVDKLRLTLEQLK